MSDSLSLAVLTTVGQQAILAAGIAGGAPVQLTQIALGSTNRAATGNENALTSEFARIPIQTSTVDNVNDQINIATLFDGNALGLTQDYSICEVGLFDADARLIWYWSTATGSLGALTPDNDFSIAFALAMGAAPSGAVTVVDQGAPGDLILEQRMTTAEGAIAVLQGQAANAAAAQTGIATIDVSGGPVTNLTADQAAKGVLIFTDAMIANGAVIFPPQGKWIVANRTTGAFTLTCKTQAGNGVAITQGKAAPIFGDGQDINFADSDPAAMGAIAAAAAAIVTLEAAVAGLPAAGAPVASAADLLTVKQQAIAWAIRI